MSALLQGCNSVSPRCNQVRLLQRTSHDRLHTTEGETASQTWYPDVCVVCLGSAPACWGIHGESSFAHATGRRMVNTVPCPSRLRSPT